MVCLCVCVCVCVNVPLFDSHFLLRRLIPSGSPPSLSGGDAGAHRTPEPPTPEALRGLLRSLLPSAPPRRWLRCGAPPSGGAPGFYSGACRPPAPPGGGAGARRTPEPPLRRVSGGDSGTLRPRSASGPALRRLTGGDSGTLRPRSASGPGSRLASSTPEHSGATPTPGPT